MRAAIRGTPPGAPSTTRRRGRSVAGSAFGQGLLSNLGNPKMAVFFASVFPQFAPPGPDTVVTLVALGLVFAGLTLLWLGLYAIVLARAGALTPAGGVRRALDAVVGVSLIGLGAKVATEHR